MSNETNHTPPVSWLDDIAESEAQVAAGQVVPLEPVLERIRGSIARMEARRTEQPVQALKA